MKYYRTITVFMLSGIFVSGIAPASDMQGMEMKDKPTPHQVSATPHHAVGVVKKVDATNGSVTIAHEPVKSLGWPAMTMPFAVKDKALLDELTEGKKVEFDFVQQGGTSTITSVK